MSAATMTISVAIPASDTRAIELAWAARAVDLAMRAARSAGGGVTNGTISSDGAQPLGTWTYAPGASS